MKELQQAQGCRGRTAAARSGVRRSRDSLRAAWRTAATSSRSASTAARARDRLSQKMYLKLR
eukprot:1973612-Prymnesium_polylepis.1